MKKQFDFSMVSIEMGITCQLDMREHIDDSIINELSNFIPIGGKINFYSGGLDGEDKTIGSFSLYLITGNIRQILSALDGYSFNTSTYFEEILTYEDDYLDILYGHEKLMLLNRITIDEEYRGNGLIKHLIKTIDRIYEAPIMLKPYPLQFELTDDNEEEIEKLGSIKPHMKKVVKSYEKCGFIRVHKKSEFMIRESENHLEEINWD